jgi:chromosomal replication initiator protein
MMPDEKPDLTRRAFLRLCALAWLGSRAGSRQWPVSPRLAATPHSSGPLVSTRYTFDSFVVSPHNQEAFAAVWAVAQRPIGTYNPLFIHGEAGLGKTHLLVALGQHLAASDRSRRVLYLHGRRFAHLANEATVGACAARRFCQGFRQADVVLMDDVHHVAAETDRDFSSPYARYNITGAVAQNVFLEQFVEMYATLSKLFIFSSLYAPDVIPGLGRHLEARFSWGKVAEIQTPSPGKPIPHAVRAAEIRRELLACGP